MYISVCMYIYIQTAKVLELKQIISKRIHNTPPHRQKLIIDYRGQGTGTILDDDKSLSHYSSVQNGSVLFLVLQIPFKVYVQDPRTKIYDIEIPSSNPEVCILN